MANQTIQCDSGTAQGTHPPVVEPPNPHFIQHAIRTAVAATVSLLAARLLHLPSPYWAPISTLVIMQSTLGAALTISMYRLAGTALGAAVAILAAGYFGANALAFGVTVFVIGILCAALRLGRTAYRFASITLAIVMLVESSQPAWIIAVHRFVEVTLGIVVGLLITALWPERSSPPSPRPAVSGGPGTA